MDKTPGPGSYKAESTLCKKGRSFGKETVRARKQKSTVPGPGQYAIKGHSTKESAPRYGFGSESRDRRLSAANATPGPGNYKIEGHYTKRNAPRGLLVPRRPDSAPGFGRGTPGPGQYASSMIDKKSAPKFGFGTQCKATQLNKDRVKTPGAGTYSPSTKKTLRQTPSYGMGTS